ncbi:BTB/POZ domain-containing protein 6-like isoform X2 [Plodia interpunctella]|uniref:BTB/POZ domain-containing protein 6-like isoform X2 n=1 Tax=Plodia interpunctella TaxID=58824 RepID=UPI002367F80C|nr:BTB/POZ domain-containing protein 6-like isoform X2 [Plodia interpunctella]
MTQVQKDWQLKCAVIKDRSGQILETGTWADCKFLVGQSMEQKHFNAHKLILAMASPVFETMFYGVLDEKDVILIPDSTPDSFEAMLEYIYTDKIIINSFDDASALYYNANKYMLPYLIEGCVKYLTSTLKTDNVCQTYEFAKMFDEHELMDTCLQLIQRQTSEVLHSTSFIDANLSTVQYIFSLIPLNIDNELELFKAAERYAKKNGVTYSDHCDESLGQDNEENSLQCVKDNEESTPPQSQFNKDIKLQDTKNENENEKHDAEEVIFRSLLGNIQLLTLTPQQFAEEVAQSPFITRDEVFAILMNIASTNTDISIPEGFNESRKQRYKVVADPANNQDLGLDKSKARSQTVFRFIIPDFRKSKHISIPFVVRNLSWRIAINPRPEVKLDQECLAIFLYCDHVNKAATWSCSARAEISIISNKSNAVHLLKKIEHTFSRL